jgi:hypothetical protein
MPRKSLFEFPDDVKTTVSKGTKALYRSKINSIAKATNLTNVDMLLAMPSEVFKAIEELVPETKPDYKPQRRLYMSALMYIFNGVPYEERTEFYAYYLTVKDPYTPTA